jgi:ABC-2 type transport system ATP-binding protein
VSINGIDLSEDPIACKNQIGILPEFPPLYHDMKVVDYLKFVARLHGVSSEKVKSLLDGAIEKLSLEHVANRLIGNLSKGFKQRVGIAQHLVHDPKIILLDEPTAGLDPASVNEIRELVKDLSKSHTIFISSHLLHEIQMICDELTIINHGHLVKTGRTEDILQMAQGSTACELLLASGSVEALKIAEARSDFSRFESQPDHDKTRLKLFFDSGEEIIP